MNKIITSFAILLVCFQTAEAQITITSSGMQDVGVDTFVDATNPSLFSSFQNPKTDGNWDFSTATYPSNGITLTRLPSFSTSFASANYFGSYFYPFAGSLSYEVDVYFKRDGQGLTGQGEDIGTDQNLSLASVTGNANDQLVFPAQTIPYANNEKQYQFPITFGSNWSSKPDRVTQFKLTVAAMGLTNVPGERKTYRTTADSVIGWGKVKVKPYYNSSQSIEISVLQVKHTIDIVDSFFIGGNPAPTSLLAAFGLTQGNSSKAYEVKFIRSGEIEPVVEITFPNGDNSKSANRVRIHANRLDNTTSVQRLYNVSAVEVYPNPISGNFLNLQTPIQNQGKWSYILRDMTGRTLLQNRFISTGVNHKIALPNALKEGRYMLTLAHQGLTQSTHIITKLN